MSALRAAFGTIAAFFVCTAAALALNANGWSTPRSYSGVCPATITLNGQINGGNSGAAVQYLFYYLDPSTNTVVGLPMQTGTLDASGALTTSASVSVDAAHAGASWVKLSAQSGGASTDSSITSFSVSCTSSSAPTPNPGPSNPGPPSGGTGSAPTAPSSNYITRMNHRIPPVISAPAIRLTKNPADCTSHVGDVASGLFAPLACKAAMDQGNVVLVWDWTAITDCPPARICPAIDGFHIYAMHETRSMARMGGASGPSLVDTQATDITLSTPRSGSCFAVTAFSGKDESPLSNIVCSAPVAAVTEQHASFSSVHVRSGFECKGNNPNASGLPGCHDSGPYGGCHDDACSKLTVGYLYAESSEALGDLFDNWFYRSGVLFDLRSIRGRNITRATLRMRIVGSQGNPSCINKIGDGYRDWWNEPGDGVIDENTSDPIDGTLSGNDVQFDVTRIVRNWAQGRTNYGFVLGNLDENLRAFTNKRCLTDYGAYASLDVDFM